MSIIELMAAPFAECMILVAIHTYLGIHVLKRRVIFVDLALAQIAALGTTVGFLFGIMPDTTAALLFSMAFAFVGAGVFSLTRFKNDRIPQEAIIGLTYALAAAVAILVVDRTHGAEHLKDIMVGNLLWVSWSEVFWAAGVYALVGVLHFVFRKQFLYISENHDGAMAAGFMVRAWDFLFYLTFGIVIAFSTRVAGVLLVFVFLVAPAILAFMVTSKLWLQLLIGWLVGTFVTVLGLYASWALDLPSGPSVISFYGIAVLLGGIIYFVWQSKRRLVALGKVMLGSLATVLLVLIFWTGGKYLASSPLAFSKESAIAHEIMHADQAIATQRENMALQGKQQALQGHVKDCVGPNKINSYLSWQNSDTAFMQIRDKLMGNPIQGLEFLLIALWDEETPPFYREEARELLEEHFNTSFGVDPELGPSDNRQALEQICSRIRQMKKTR